MVFSWPVIGRSLCVAVIVETNPKKLKHLQTAPRPRGRSAKPRVSRETARLPKCVYGDAFVSLAAVP